MKPENKLISLISCILISKISPQFPTISNSLIANFTVSSRHLICISDFAKLSSLRSLHPTSPGDVSTKIRFKPKNLTSDTTSYAMGCELLMICNFVMFQQIFKDVFASSRDHCPCLMAVEGVFVKCADCIFHVVFTIWIKVLSTLSF